MGRQLKFTVKLGDRLLVRVLPWSEVSRLKELVKEFSRWDPESRCWIAELSEVLRYAGLASSALSEAFGREGEEAVRRVVEADKRVREEAAERGELIVLPEDYIENYTAYKLFRRCSEPSLREIAGIPIRYFKLDVEKAAEFLLDEGIRPEELCNALLDLIQEVDPSITKRQVELVREAVGGLEEGGRVLIQDGETGAIVKFPRRLSSQEFSRLVELCSVDYYIQRACETGVELVATKLTFLDTLSSRAFRIPYFAVSDVKEYAIKLGFRVEERIEWPSRRVEISGSGVKLYRFQVEALEAWKRAGMRGTVVMPTGAGKTFVALAAMWELKLPSLVCVTTVELAKQWVRRIKEYLGVDSGLLAGGERRVEDFTVATYHSAARRLNELYDKFGLVVYDEGHHLPAETFREIALRLKARYSMVLSATPERADKNEALIYKAAGGPVYSASYLDLVLRGVLAPLRIERIYVDLTPRELLEYLKLEGGEELGELRRTTELMRIALSARNKLDALKTIVRSEEGRIIVFCQYLDQAEAAFKAVREVEPRCALITGSIAKGKRLRALRNFMRGELRVLVATTVLDEGVDVPDADVAVILSGSGQVRQMIQRVGRVLRWTPGKIARVYEIVARETIEEALSKSRSVFKLLDYREVRAAMEAATWAFGRMRELIEEYRNAPLHRRGEILERAREEYVRLINAWRELHAL